MFIDLDAEKLFNTKFKSYKIYSHYEQPNVKCLLDQLAKKYYNDFSYNIIPAGFNIHIYIKSKLYYLVKNINNYTYYLYGGQYECFESTINKKNKLYKINSEGNIIQNKIINDKYFSHKEKFFGLASDNLIIQISYKIRPYYLKKNIRFNYIFYKYKYIENYIYIYKINKSPIADIYKFIGNWRISILFI